MSGKGKHAKDDDTCKVRHSVEGPRVTWADTTGGTLCRTTVSNRLRHGGGRCRMVNEDTSSTARWPNPVYEPHRGDELRRGLYEREDGDWYLDGG